MITAHEAEDLATQKVQEYVNACRCDSIEDVGKALLKLLSVSGQAAVATQGQSNAVAMVESVAKHIAKPIFSAPYKCERVDATKPH